MNIKNFYYSFRDFSYTNLLICLVLIKAIAMVLVIFFGGIGLSPDEAQYWTWSRSLDWGYYSKPPGIAWQIWAGTQLFGHTELGVRFVSILFSMAQALAVYFLALQCKFKLRTAFYCGIMMALCPIGMLGSLLAITDGGFLLFWTLSCLVMVTALNDNRPANPLLIGVTILFGALFKWPIYLFWIAFFIFRWRYFPKQPLVQCFLGVLISLLGLLPTLWWSWSHDWATFRHVATIVQGGNVTHLKGNFLEYIGSQFLLLSPVLFILSILAYVKWLKTCFTLSPQLFFCGATSISSLLFVAMLSIFQKVQGNWGLFIYPTAIILIGWYACEVAKKQIWVRLGVGVSLAMIGMLLALPHLPMDHSMYKISPFKHNLGWVQLKEVLEKNGYDPEKNFLVSDKYQTTSILSFYSEGQKRAYFLNLHGSRRNQFSYWPQLHEEQKGQIGYFVWVENTPHFEKQWKDKYEFYQSELKKYFDQVEFLEISPLLHHEGEIVKGVFLFKCQNCKEHQPNQSHLY